MSAPVPSFDNVRVGVERPQQTAKLAIGAFDGLSEGAEQADKLAQRVGDARRQRKELLLFGHDRQRRFDCC